MSKRNPSALRLVLGSVFLLAVVAVFCGWQISRTRVRLNGGSIPLVSSPPSVIPTPAPTLKGGRTARDRAQQFNDATDRFNGPATDAEKP